MYCSSHLTCALIDVLMMCPRLVSLTGYIEEWVEQVGGEVAELLARFRTGVPEKKVKVLVMSLGQF